jgi:hypothetical protein
MPTRTANDTLVALVPSRRDWDLILTQGWYRIPVRFAPPMVKDGSVQYIALCGAVPWSATRSAAMLYKARVGRYCISPRRS